MSHVLHQHHNSLTCFTNAETPTSVRPIWVARAQRAISGGFRLVANSRRRQTLGKALMLLLRLLCVGVVVLVSLDQFALRLL